MKQIVIRPLWTIQAPEGPLLPARLVELLVQVADSGSLLQAARTLGLSYRRAWDLARQGEQLLGAPLLQMQRGRGSRLTDLGARLVHADQHLRGRLQPLLAALTAELTADLHELLR